jgi:hypothetical protein
MPLRDHFRSPLDDVRHWEGFLAQWSPMMVLFLAFVGKCAALLQNRVSVAIIDLVTTRNFNLYGELLELIGQTDPLLNPEPPPLYTVACRMTKKGDVGMLETWAQPLAIGQPLPTMPLWLADDFALPLELEGSYEQTCRVLRIP